MRLPITTTHKLEIKTIQSADAVITETPIESEYICKHYKAEKEKVFSIPNGVDESFVYDDCIFNEILNQGTEYVLCVGRFDENKNQLNLIRAIKNTGIDVVFVGGKDALSDAYYQKCVDEANGYDNVHFLGWLPDDSALLRSAYGNAKMIVAPSYDETFGLTIVQGAALGAQLAMSKTLPILSWGAFNSKDCTLFDPQDVDDMRDKILNLWKKEKTGDLMLSVKSAFSWTNIIDEHVKIYTELLK